MIKKLFSDQRGALNSVEIMFIIGIVVVVAGSIMGVLSNETTGLPHGAGAVTDKVNHIIESGEINP